MKTFVNYYGGKWRVARDYGPPQRQHVIEPFAGFAGYSTYWEPKRVTLIEKDPTVFGIWHYLIHATGREIRKLPVAIESLDELPGKIPQEARDLIGFWFNRAVTAPSKRRSNWARSARYRHMFWGAEIRERLATQVERIRHWQIIEGSYEQAPDIDGHWFVDPPYSVRGHYKHNSIDYRHLAKWCRNRKGFTHVCENDGADWLPFEPLTLVQTHRPRGFSAEAVFEQDQRERK